MKTFMNKSIDIELFVIIIVSFLVGFYAKNSFFKNGQNRSLYTKIHNKFDSEHEDILNACDNLYNACEKHWDTEEKYYEKGIQNMPPAHKNITGEWQAHRQEHINTLNGIKNTIIDIINAIVKSN